jgi:hypothetical protein
MSRDQNDHIKKKKTASPYKIIADYLKKKIVQILQRHHCQIKKYTRYLFYSQILFLIKSQTCYIIDKTWIELIHLTKSSLI